MIELMTSTVTLQMWQVLLLSIGTGWAIGSIAADILTRLMSRRSSK